MTTVTTRFSGFHYSAAELSAYARTLDVFVISLRTGEVIRHYPDDIVAFEAWLRAHGVRNIADDR